VNRGDKPNQQDRSPDSLVDQQRNENPPAPTAQEPQRLPAQYPSTESHPCSMSSVPRTPDYQLFSVQGVDERGDMMNFSDFDAPFDSGLQFFHNEPTWFSNEPLFFDGTSAMPGPIVVQDSGLATQGAGP
jgi:hypothetical protein